MANVTRAPATHLWYNDPLSGDILLQDVYVPADGVQPDTYYACLTWNTNKEGGGYLGIQAHQNGDHSYIYSLWDPQDPKLSPIKAVYTGLWGKISHFGSEGHGIHMGNHSLGWAPDKWYTTATRRWDDHGHTRFGFWVHNQSSKVWTHMVTFDYPVLGVNFNTVSNSFMENFKSSGNLERKVRYGHGYKRGVDKTWHPFTKAHYTVNQGDNVKDFQHNYNAGADYGYFFMESGGNIQPKAGLGFRADFEVTLPPTPIKDPIEFEITEATAQNVAWKVPESSTPQFSYTVVVDGKQQRSEVAPEVRSHRIASGRAGLNVSVTLEDLLGNVVTKSKTLK